MKPNIILPNRNGAGENETYQTENNIVIIGGNGAGKTRLGVWIEENLQNQVSVHRISAQRALNIPDYVSVRNLEQAEKLLSFGNETEQSNVDYKRGHRWGNNPETHLLNDYDQLLSALFAKGAKRDAEYTKQAMIELPIAPPPESPIEIITRLWKDIMPQREVAFIDGKVLANKNGHPAYHGKSMSDGERVTLYMIGQCLSAPDNSLIVIDEPELHLHKSLMARLWNKIEEECPNKLLVYITHDLDFAASRKEAKKFWIKDFIGGTNWIWDEVPEIEEIPENLIIEIAGNRKNVIFVEGEKWSKDNILYQAVFPDHHIISRGGCDKVVESTKAMRGNPSLHHVEAFGIIDRDYRNDEEIVALQKAGVFTVNVAEVENLFLLEPILRIVANHLGLEPDLKVEEIKKFVFKRLLEEFEVQVSNCAEQRIQFRLGAYTKKNHSEQGLDDGFKSLIENMDISTIFQECKNIYQEAIDENNLEKALKLFNRKNLHKEISRFFGLNNGEYIELVLRLLKTNKKSEIITAVQKFMPSIV